jgi:LytS/YehU family sensor histidine kinase
MKKAYPVTGLIISLFIALLGYILRMNRDEGGGTITSLVASFANCFLSWLLIQIILLSKRPASYSWKGVIAIAGCMFISLIPITITRHFDEVQNRIATVPGGMRAINFLLLIRGLIIGGFLFFLAYLLKISAIRQQSQMENERLKQENLQARLSLLQEQVSPHFLFNSLGTLQSMVSDKAPRQFIQRLSEVYRYLLSNRMSDLVLLKAELDFTLAYLHILKERFEEALDVNIVIPKSVLQKKLPPATLQLLIENAVKHNLATAENPLRIMITNTNDNWLVVRNSLQRKTVAAGASGIGLKNIRERYQLVAGANIMIEEKTGQFIVRIPLI